MKRLSIALISGVLLLLGVSASSAHTELISSSPEPNSTITAPQRISLNFIEAPILAGSAIVVEAPDGTMLDTAPATLKGRTLSTEWPTSAKPGYLTVNWRAVADDGHVIIDSFTFLYQPPGSEVDPDTEVLATLGEPSNAARGGFPINPVFGVIVVALIAAALFFIFRSRRQK